MKKYFLSAFLFCFGYTHCQTGSKANKDLKKTCISIAEAYVNKQTQEFNNYIEASSGIYFITRPGAHDTYSHIKKVETSTLPAYFYSEQKATIVSAKEIRFVKKLQFDCEKESWNGTGLLADTSNTLRPISRIITFRKDNFGETVSASDLNSVIEQEKKYRKIVVTSLREGSGLIFYVFQKKGKWYLAAIDLAESDCGA